MNITDKMTKLKKMSNTANCYFIAAERCMEERPIDLKSFQMLPIPALTCIAFSCEVYLKALLFYFDTPISNTHNLKELFDLLPKDAKENIQKLYKNPLRFDNDLNEIKEYFVTSRYLYEQEAGSFYFDFITWFCKELKKMVNNQIEKLQ